MLVADLVLIHHKGPLSALPARKNSVLQRLIELQPSSVTPATSPLASSLPELSLTSLLEPNEASFGSPHWFEWKTCLRQITIGFQDRPCRLLPTFEGHVDVLRGKEAYEQILEIMCGLQSPLFGETEVFGQFKEHCQKFSTQNKYWDSRFAKVFTKLLSDAKSVRNKHLRDLGSQSYGSLVRKETRQLHQMMILGSGHLAREILPWVVKEKNFVEVIARSTESARETLPYTDLISIQSYSDVPKTREPFALVIAAPLTSEEILKWLTQIKIYPELIIDLRSESEHDSIRTEARVIDLQNVFLRIENTRALQSEVKSRAQEHIRELSALRVDEFECRPFGWDELCAL